jgi:hypothetical protein
MTTCPFEETVVVAMSYLTMRGKTRVRNDEDLDVPNLEGFRFDSEITPPGK